MENSEKPVLFINIEETFDENNNKHYTFNLTPEAMQLLTSIQDRNVHNLTFNSFNQSLHPLNPRNIPTKIAVLVIAGPQRTGKSFLANRFLKRMKGFEIGATTNPCTKGIWIWNKPIRLNDTTDMIILDTEGLNSVRTNTLITHTYKQQHNIMLIFNKKERDSTIDLKIFSISLLLASTFIYNNLGHIDE